ncbi:MAG: sucrase ferredoxin [Nitrospirales bacterium]|nr:sucrase ferredoxin [Nitrospirales bacterium]
MSAALDPGIDPTNPDIFCSDLSREAGEAMVGTAVTTNLWLLLEYLGPWSAKATEDNDLPPPVQAWLQEQLALAENSRLQFIKQNRPPEPSSSLTFFLALTREFNPRLYQFTLNTYHDLLKLDIPALLAGAGSYDRFLRIDPLYLVCTNGRRDRCCSLLGLTLYQALDLHVGEATWQCTHLGGHRFAPTVATFPNGAYYGRLSPSDLEPFIQAQESNQLYLSHLRGRCCYDDVTQAADHFLRQETGILELEGYRLLDAQPLNETRWAVRFRSPATGEIHRLTLDREISAAGHLVSCSPPKTKPVVRFRFISHDTAKM